MTSMVVSISRWRSEETPICGNSRARPLALLTDARRTVALRFKFELQHRRIGCIVRLLEGEVRGFRCPPESCAFRRRCKATVERQTAHPKGRSEAEEARSALTVC